MIKLTYGQMDSEVFWQAIGVLTSSVDMPISTALNMIEIHKALGAERETASVIIGKITDKYSEKDGNGKPKLIEEDVDGVTRHRVPVIEGMREEYAKDMKEFFDTEFTIGMSPLKVSDLEGVKMTPQMVHSLRALIVAD